MTEFEFIDYDPRGNKDQLLLREFAEVLRGNPDRWARYPMKPKSPVSASSIARRINIGQNKTFLPDDTGRFEGASSDGCVFVRFLKADQPVTE